jgi:hypothetical protein
MAGTIELRGLMRLTEVFKERSWPQPYFLPLPAGQLSGRELLTMLEIAEDQVEVLFINGKAAMPADAVISPGDRVALVPPGTPGPYRVYLGFVKLDKKK